VVAVLVVLVVLAVMAVLLVLAVVLLALALGCHLPMRFKHARMRHSSRGTALEFLHICVLEWMYFSSRLLSVKPICNACGLLPCLLDVLMSRL
jgi:hypothetical protein